MSWLPAKTYSTYSMILRLCRIPDYLIIRPCIGLISVFTKVCWSCESVADIEQKCICYGRCKRSFWEDPVGDVDVPVRNRAVGRKDNLHCSLCGDLSSSLYSKQSVPPEMTTRSDYQRHENYVHEGGAPRPRQYIIPTVRESKVP